MGERGRAGENGTRKDKIPNGHKFVERSINIEHRFDHSQVYEQTILWTFIFGWLTASMAFVSCIWRRTGMERALISNAWHRWVWFRGYFKETITVCLLLDGGGDGASVEDWQGDCVLHVCIWGVFVLRIETRGTVWIIQMDSPLDEEFSKNRANCQTIYENWLTSFGILHAARENATNSRQLVIILSFA